MSQSRYKGKRLHPIVYAHAAFLVVHPRSILSLFLPWVVIIALKKQTFVNYVFLMRS